MDSFIVRETFEAGDLPSLQEAIDCSLFVYRKVIKDNCTLHAKSLTYTICSRSFVLVVILSCSRPSRP